MSATTGSRRRSSRIQQPSAIDTEAEPSVEPAKIKRGGTTTAGRRKRADKSVHNEEVVEASESDKDEQDDDEDWGNKKKAKRARTSKNGKGSNGKTGSAKLSLLPTMPLDILYEIMSHIPPRDLLNLCIINKDFFNMFSAADGMSVWKRVRADCGAPDPPPGFSEYNWARLLFGLPRCSVCNTNGVHTVDFGLRKRACHACIKKKVVSDKRFNQVFEFLDKEILDLIPFSKSNNLPFQRCFLKKFYWIPEVEYMASELGKYASDISLRKPAAKQRLSEFIEHRKEVVKLTREMVPVAEEWSHNMWLERNMSASELIEKRRAEIKKRFLELGFAEVDINQILNREEVRRTTSLNKHSWNLVRGPLEAGVWSAKIRRLDNNHGSIISQRKADFVTRYTAYSKSLPGKPIDWVYLPPLSLCYANSEIRSLVYADVDADITAESFDKVMDTFHEFVAETKKTKMDKVLHSFHDHDNTVLNKIAEERKVDGPVPTVLPEQLMDLACIAFTCFSYPCLDNGPFLGKEEVFRHECALAPHCGVGYLLPYSVRAAHVVNVAGLDFRTAAIEDMDDLNPQFLCEDCHDGRVFSWREAVRHYHSPGRLRLNAWRLCTELELEQVDVEETYDLESSKNWSCNHCSVHCGDYQAKVVVVDHVQAEHGIGIPRIRKDFILKPGKQYYSLNPTRRMLSTD